MSYAKAGFLPSAFFGELGNNGTLGQGVKQESGQISDSLPCLLRTRSFLFVRYFQWNNG
jgi:hypothetical protein